MIKLKVIVNNIMYSKFEKIAKIERFEKTLNTEGMLYKNDTIWVNTREEANYLCGNNAHNLKACEELAVEETPLETATKKSAKVEKAVKKANVRKNKVLQK